MNKKFITPDETALLIIDVQMGIFMRKVYDGMAVYNEESLIANLKALIEKAKSASVPVIYIQHMYENFPPMEKGQPGWEIHPDLKSERNDIVIEKRHADAFFESILADELKRLNVKNLIITGLQTAFCVDTTCRRAYSLGYKNILVSDGHSSLDSDVLPAKSIIAHHNSVLGSQFADLATTEEIAFV